MQGAGEAHILIFVHGAVDVVAAGIVASSVAIGRESSGHVDAAGLYNRGDGVIKVKIVFTGIPRDLFGHRGRGQRTRRDNRGRVPGQSGNFLSYHLNVGMTIQCFSDAFSEAKPVYRQGAASRHGSGFGTTHEQRTQHFHFRLQDTCRAIGQLGTKGVAANQFRQPITHMSAGRSLGAHFV